MENRRPFLGGLLSFLWHGSRRPDPGPSQATEPRGPAAAPRPRYRHRPSYGRLVHDLRRPTPAARRDAEAALLDRVPDAALPWIVAVVEDEDWHALRAVVRTGRSEREIEAAMIAAALAEQERQEAEEERKRRKKKKGGAAGQDHRPASGWKP